MKSGYTVYVATNTCPLPKCLLKQFFNSVFTNIRCIVTGIHK